MYARRFIAYRRERLPMLDRPRLLPGLENGSIREEWSVDPFPAQDTSGRAIPKIFYH